MDFGERLIPKLVTAGLSVVGPSSLYSPVLVVSASSSQPEGARIHLMRARGSGEDATQSQDILGEVVAYGHNGSDFARCGMLRMTQDGAVSGSSVPCRVLLMGMGSSGTLNAGLTVRASGTTEIHMGLAHQGSTVGLFGATPTTKGTITGSRGGNVALASLLTYLALRGDITDSTS